MTDYADFFSSDGPFAGHVHGFSPRPQQQAMAEAVGQALDTGEALAVEAGTGIGKTFAYLVPALLSGRRVIISTGTRNLQDQLFHRDLPTVARARRDCSISISKTWHSNWRKDNPHGVRLHGRTEDPARPGGQDRAGS